MGAARSAVHADGGNSGSRSSFRHRWIERRPVAHPVAPSTLPFPANLYTINTPRQVRVRLASSPTRGGRVCKPAYSDGDARQQQGLHFQSVPNSPMAQSAGTGRTALGPWCGPYGASAGHVQGMPSNPTLYLDRVGSVHFDLKDGLKTRVRAARSPRPQEQMLALTGIFACSEPGKGRAELRDHSREVVLAASKGEPKGGGAALGTARFSTRAKRHSGHQVFQPSGRFY